MYIRDAASGRLIAVASGAGDYRSVKFDRSGLHLASLSDRTERGTANSDARYSIYHAQLTDATTTIAVSATTLSAAGLRISPLAGVQFSGAGNALIFAVSPLSSAVAPQNESKSGAVFDLWRWNEPSAHSVPVSYAGSTARESGCLIGCASRCLVRRRARMHGFAGSQVSYRNMEIVEIEEGRKIPVRASYMARVFVFYPTLYDCPWVIPISRNFLT